MTWPDAKLQCEKETYLVYSTLWIYSGDISYVQTVPNHRRLLIIDDKSLPHKKRHDRAHGY